MKNDQKTICVIPARRGSKRVKLKNIVKICGQPVIAYSILAAKKSRLFDAVYVATEDKEIAAIAKKYGATIPCLVPKKLTGDLVPSWKPCVYLVDYLQKEENKHYQNLVCLQPTSILRTGSDIRRSLKLFLQKQYDFLISATPVDPHFFHWAVIQDKKNQQWHMYFKNKYLKDRHELPDVYRPDGSLKIAKIAKLKKYRSFFGPNLGVALMPAERSIHIASELDLRLATLFLKDYAKK